MPYTLKRDYIRLAAITYQSFGLDKNKAPAFASALFLVRETGLDGLCPSFAAFHFRTPDCVRLRREGPSPYLFLDIKIKNLH